MAHTDESQNRGDLSAYDRYLAGMDTSMRQKVALTAAHLLGQGKVADMGMGSGLGSHALAALYPYLQVVGVDLDPVMVELAQERYRLPNLSFKVGDIAQPVFEPESLDGIFDSSVLHHVTTFGGYHYENAAKALEAQVTQLKKGGVLIVRDFVAPEGGDVFLDLPADDGDDSKDPATCSTASLFERFATEFRSLAEVPGFQYQRVMEGAPGNGWRRYRLPMRMAAEFILRKDYRRDWVAEVKEEYCYFTQAEFQNVFARMGLRMLASTPLRNPWILRNRWQGKCEIRDLEGQALEFPPTNTILAGERVAPGEGVAFRNGGEVEPLGFLRMESFRHRGSGEVWDLVSRPHRTLDVLPFFHQNQEIFVLARMSYPRPILGSMAHASATLHGGRPSGYLTEPLSVLQTDQPMGFTVEAMLAKRAGIAPSAILGFTEGATYYPSPGGILEEVQSVLVETEPVFVQGQIDHHSGFSTSGRVRAIEAQQLLRSAQVGGLPDARLELNTYELLLRLGVAPGAWIGEEITLKENPVPLPKGLVVLDPWRECATRRVFECVSTECSPSYLHLHATRFEEVDAQAKVVAEGVLEYVVPREASTNTLTVALLYRHEGEIYIGLEDRDLPAAQGFTGNSALLAAPAWRLPRSVQNLAMSKAWAQERLAKEFGVIVQDLWELGGSYHPTAGLTPEAVYPMAAEVERWNVDHHSLIWTNLKELCCHRASIQDGHLRILSLRASHAMKLM